jgi:hypothetical protein
MPVDDGGGFDAALAPSRLLPGLSRSPDGQPTPARLLLHSLVGILRKLLHGW